MTESMLRTSDWEACESGDLRRFVRGLRVRRRDRQAARVIGIGGAAAVLVLVGFIALTQLRGAPQYNYGNIACQDVRDDLPDYMAGRVDEQLAKKIDLHLAACPECGPMFQNMKSEMSTAQNPRHDHASCRCTSCSPAPMVAMLENNR
jgi:hypothetical protein